MLRATELAHLILRQAVRPGAWTVDATVGNGHDTLFLAQLVGPNGRVFGFDVQSVALAATAERVRGQSQVTLIHSGHEILAKHLPADAKGQLAAVMFNLGYLPGAAKDTTTRTETTISALNQALDYLTIGGLITLVLYPGHPGGGEEAAAVRAYAQNLPAAFSVGHYARLNCLEPAPELLVIERVR
jgi:predicted methyltransferase